MKTIVALAAFVAATATPALAQAPKRPATHHTNVVVHPDQNAQDSYGANAYGADSNAVYDSEGHYVGSDPDPRVRTEMRRDPRGDD
jgi:hypothetical protein